MRKLAILAFSFSGAVFAAARLLPENWLPAGAVAAGFLFLALLVFRRGLGDSGLALRLVCAGCALGLAWTAAYIQIFFQPARELDGQTVLLCAEAADWPQEGDYGWSVLVKMKTDNIQALLNFTEILLQKMQLDVARDLALENFNAADPVQAAGDFNLDNYRFTPPTAAELEAEGGAKPEKLEKLEKEITPSSGNILTEGRKTMTAGTDEAGENTETTGDGNDEKKQ